MMILSYKPQIMGVMNITPDSFSDGGKLYSNGSLDLKKTIDQAASMVEEGADWLDVGGESTRPGAEPVTLDEELDRVIPVVEALKARFPTKISVDTSQPVVIKQAGDAGASMVNDVRALQVEGAIEAVAASGMAVCLMHMQGQPDSMQNKPDYESVVKQVYGFLQQRINDATKAGIARNSICIDPGFGFGKSLEHNLKILKSLTEFKTLRLPLLVGFSRKSMIGHITAREPEQRNAGTTVLNTLAFGYGANIFRVHNVADAVDMIKICNAVKNI